MSNTIFTEKDQDYRKEITYKEFSIVITKELRAAVGGYRREANVEKYGQTAVKKFTINYKGFEREDEFKSVPQCKRFIDKGRLNMWVKMVDKWIKDGVEPINL